MYILWPRSLTIFIVKKFKCCFPKSKVEKVAQADTNKDERNEYDNLDNSGDEDLFNEGSSDGSDENKER